MGQHAADWLEGKSVPQAMDILPRALTLQNIARYEADVSRSWVPLLKIRSVALHISRCTEISVTIPEKTL